MEIMPGSGTVLNTLNLIADTATRVLTTTNQKVVFHCAMGMERAPLAVVWYLHKNEGLSIEDAYKDVIQARPIACHREQWLTWT